jgi:hypothetical protein
MYNKRLPGSEYGINTTKGEKLREPENDPVEFQNEG